MIKHKIAYIDEERSAIIRFQSRVSQTLEVIGLLPEPNLDEFIIELLNSGVEAFVVDFNLGEYRTDVRGPIQYNGAELVEKILQIRKGFPCFVLTSYDSDAVHTMQDVNYVYPKDILVPGKRPVQLELAEKVRIQIEHYQEMLEDTNTRFHELLDLSETRQLTEKEENELLRLDSFLESALDDRTALAQEKKNHIATGRIDELIDMTSKLLQELQGGDE